MRFRIQTEVGRDGAGARLRSGERLFVATRTRQQQAVISGRAIASKQGAASPLQHMPRRTFSDASAEWCGIGGQGPEDRRLRYERETTSRRPETFSEARCEIIIIDHDEPPPEQVRVVKKTWLA